jgi:hypothetical protein
MIQFLSGYSPGEEIQAAKEYTGKTIDVSKKLGIEVNLTLTDLERKRAGDRLPHFHLASGLATLLIRMGNRPGGGGFARKPFFRARKDP